MNSRSFLQKFVVCFLTGIIGAYAVFEVSRKIFEPWLNLISSLCGVLFFCSVFYSVIWHFREKKLGKNSTSILSFWQNAICYFIAIDLCMFSWRKLFHLQLHAPQGLLDKPVSALTGEQQTIAYFSYSYPFVLCIAALQMAGS